MERLEREGRRGLDTLQGDEIKEKGEMRKEKARPERAKRFEGPAYLLSPFSFLLGRSSSPEAGGRDQESEQKTRGQEQGQAGRRSRLGKAPAPSSASRAAGAFRLAFLD